jgi:hypothetical protein
MNKRIFFLFSCFLSVLACKSDKLERTLSKTINIESSSVLVSGEVKTLIDGKDGNESKENNEGWIESNSPFFEGTIDLGYLDTVNQISTRFFIDKGKNIQAAKNVSFLFSQDGENYNEIPSFVVVCPDSVTICDFSVPAASTRMRYIKFKFENQSDSSKLKIDEIAIN